MKFEINIKDIDNVAIILASTGLSKSSLKYLGYLYNLIITNMNNNAEMKPQTSRLCGKKSCNKFPIAAIPRMGPPIEIGKCSISVFIVFNHIFSINMFVTKNIKKIVTVLVKMGR